MSWGPGPRLGWDPVPNFMVGFILVLLVLSGIGCAGVDQGTVCFEGHCFGVELAQTVDQRAKGLMFRKRLDPDKGMLFVYETEGEYSFWMKNTLIPLDIIWINKDKQVAFIGKDIQPCKSERCPSLSPNVRAKYVLELNAGITEKIGLGVGDKLEF